MFDWVLNVPLPSYILSNWCELLQPSKHCYSFLMATCYGFLICLKDDKEQSLKQDTENLLLVKVEYVQNVQKNKM